MGDSPTISLPTTDNRRKLLIFDEEETKHNVSLMTEQFLTNVKEEQVDYDSGKEDSPTSDMDMQMIDYEDEEGEEEADLEIGQEQGLGDDIPKIQLMDIGKMFLACKTEEEIEATREKLVEMTPGRFYIGTEQLIIEAEKAPPALKILYLTLVGLVELRNLDEFRKGSDLPSIEEIGKQSVTYRKSLVAKLGRENYDVVLHAQSFNIQELAMTFGKRTGKLKCLIHEFINFILNTIVPIDQQHLYSTEVKSRKGYVTLPQRILIGMSEIIVSSFVINGKTLYEHGYDEEMRRFVKLYVAHRIFVCRKTARMTHNQ